MQSGCEQTGVSVVELIRRLANECWLTFVHLDDQGRPAPVPSPESETDEDRRLHRIASDRRERVLAERSA